jgi:hypothetical protein
VAQAIRSHHHEADAKLREVATCQEAPFDTPHVPCTTITIPHTKGTIAMTIPHKMHFESKMLVYYDANIVQ